MATAHARPDIIVTPYQKRRRRPVQPPHPSRVTQRKPLVKPPATFWQKPTGQTVVPLSASVACHTVMLLGCYIAYCAATTRNDPPSHSSGVLSIAGAPVGDLPETDAASEQPHSPGTPHVVLLDAPPRPPVDAVDAGSDRADTIRAAAAPEIAVGDETFVAQVRRENIGDAPEVTDGAPASLGLGGSFTPGSSGSLITSPRRGWSSDARSVVVVFDASGSMMSMDFAVRDQTEKILRSLRRGQAFNVVVFADGPNPQALARTMLMSTPENQRRASGFVRGVKFRGSTDPIAALNLAYHQHPALIYLLTDGGFSDAGAVLKVVQTTQNRTIPVHILQFAGAAKAEETDVLRRVARESGGAYTLVDPNRP